jgi:hypothetical protein
MNLSANIKDKKNRVSAVDQNKNLKVVVSYAGLISMPAICGKYYL